MNAYRNSFRNTYMRLDFFLNPDNQFWNHGNYTEKSKAEYEDMVTRHAEELIKRRKQDEILWKTSARR